jgi:DNA-binding FrmR family transcriptional regulator
MKKDNCCPDDAVYPDYKKELSRLNRIAGQVEGIKKMIADRRYCPDILIQLRAVRAAVNAVEASVLEGHLDACVTDVFNTNNEDDKKQKIRELKDLYLKN